MPFILLFIALIIAPFANGMEEIQFQKNDSITISEITMSGNTRTKNQIILRELEFNVGDSFLTSDLENVLKKSRENLINTSLFNFIDITQNVDSNSFMLKIHVNLIERCTFYPILRLNPQKKISILGGFKKTLNT